NGIRLSGQPPAHCWGSRAPGRVRARNGWSTAARRRIDLDLIGERATLMNVRGALSLLGASMCIAVFGVCTRLVSPTFGAISQNALRFAGAALVLIGCCLIS